MILKIPPQPLPIAEIGEKYIRLKISQKATGTIRLRMAQGTMLSM